MGVGYITMETSEKKTGSAGSTGSTGLTGDERKRLNRAEMLLSISKDMAKLESLDELLQHLMGITAKEVDAQRCTIFLNDSETSELYARVAMGRFKQRIRMLNTKGHRGNGL